MTSRRGAIAVEDLCHELNLQGVVSAATPRGLRPSHPSLQTLDSISPDSLGNPENLIGRSMPAEPNQLSPVYPPAAVSAVAEALATRIPILIETDSPERAGEALRAFFRVGESDEATLMRDLSGVGAKGNVAVVSDIGTASIAGIIGGGAQSGRVLSLPRAVAPSFSEISTRHRPMSFSLWHRRQGETPSGSLGLTVLRCFQVTPPSL